MNDWLAVLNDPASARSAPPVILSEAKDLRMRDSWHSNVSAAQDDGREVVMNGGFAVFLAD